MTYQQRLCLIIAALSSLLSIDLEAFASKPVLTPEHAKAADVKIIKGLATEKVTLARWHAVHRHYRRYHHSHSVAKGGLHRHSGSIAHHHGPAHKFMAEAPLKSADDAHSRALSLIKQGRLGSADTLLKQGIESFPESEQLTSDLSKVSLQRAIDMANQGYLECAIMRAREALFLDPNNAEAEALLSELLRRTGHDPDNADERTRIAGDLAADHRYVGAIVEYREALKLKPSTDAYVGLGDMYMKANQPELARASYQQALNLNTFYAPAQSKLAKLGAPPAGELSTNPLNPRASEKNHLTSGQILSSLWKANGVQNILELARGRSANYLAYSKHTPASKNSAHIPIAAKPSYHQAPPPGDMMGPINSNPASSPLTIPGIKSTSPSINGVSSPTAQQVIIPKLHLPEESKPCCVK